MRWLVITYHSRALDPHETSCKDICAHLPSHLAFETIAMSLFSTAKPYHVNMHVTITRTLRYSISASRSARMQVLSDFTPSDAMNGLVSARDCCMRATNFFAESLSSDLHHMRLRSYLFLIRSNFCVRFILLLKLSPGPSSLKGDVLASSQRGS